MEATVLTFSMLHRWKLANRVMAPLVLSADTVDHSAIFPALFHHKITSLDRLSDPNSHDMVQVITFADLVGTEAITSIIDTLPNIPLIVILFQYSEAEDGRVATAINPAQFDIIKQRQGLIDRWKRKKEVDGNKDVEFINKAESLFGHISSQLHIGGISSLTLQWQSRITKELQFLENAGARFLAIKQAAGEPEPRDNALEKPKRIKTVMSYAFGDSGDDISFVPPDPQHVGDVENPNPTSDLDAELSQMTDPLSLFLRYAGGSYGSTISKLYRHKPTSVHQTYGSWKRLQEYCTATRDWVIAALRRLQSDATRWSREIHGKKWHLLAVLCHPESEMFFLSARLCGFYMRDSELQQVTRANRTLNDMTKHIRDVNDASELLIHEIRKYPALCCSFIEF